MSAVVNPIPFSFAKRYGVLFAGIENDQAKIIYRDTPNILVLNELRRYLNRPLILEQATEEKFNLFLIKSYETDSNTAMLMAEDMGESMNLFDLIQELPKPEDLLEH